MIVFGSRGSDLALTQSRMIAERVRTRTGEEYRIEVIETRGDRILDQPLPSIGGKGLFTAELEAALTEGRIDVAVHSMKDLPVEDPAGLCIGAVPERAKTCDVLVYDPTWEDPEGGTVPLRGGARIGTSSHRRRSALRTLRTDFEHADIRGNVPTRVDKVRRGDYGGVMLAAAGIERLGLELGGLVRVELPVERFTPAPAQGALAVQCRRDDPRVLELLQSVHDPETASCAHAERELLAALGGGCSMPLGALVTPLDDGYELRAALFDNPETHPDGGHGVFVEMRGADPNELARQAADRLRPLCNDPLCDVRVCLLRPGGAGGELSSHLGVAGALVETIALTEVLPIHPEHLGTRLAEGCTLAFTSARAVDRLFEELTLAGLDLGERRVFAGGPATAEALRSRGLDCTSPPAGAGGGAALAECMLGAGVKRDDVVCFPCAEDRHDELERRLRERGVDVRPLPLYRVEPLPEVVFPETEHDFVVFTSPSAVRAYASTERNQRGCHVALGNTTAAAMDECGVRRHGIASTPTAAALIETILELRHARPS